MYSSATAISAHNSTSRRARCRKRGGEQQRDDEAVRARERPQEDRHEPAQEVILGAGVEDEVLRQPARAVVVVAELLVEVVDDGRVTPPRDRDEEVVDETEQRDARRQHRAASTTSGTSSSRRDEQRAAEEVRADGNQVVLEREPDRGPVGRAVKPALRQHRVHAHDEREREREHVDERGCETRAGARAPRRRPPARARPEEDFLPGLERGQSAPANSRAVQSGHDRVVRGQADEPRVQRDHRPSPDEDRRGNRAGVRRPRARVPKPSGESKRGGDAQASPPRARHQLPHGIHVWLPPSPKRPQNRGLMLPRGSAD